MDSHRRRILYVDPSGQWWGSEQSLFLLMTHIDRTRFDISLSVPMPSELATHARDVDMSVRHGMKPNLHKNATVFAKLGSLFRLFQNILLYRPDLIHLNQAGAIRYVLGLARMFGIPVIVHVRLAIDAPFVAARYIAERDRVLFIANSKYVAGDLVKNQIAESSVVHVVNPIAIPESETLPLPPEERREDPPFVIGFVGRLSPDKGIETFLRALPIIGDMGICYEAHVIGSSNEEAAPRYEDQLHELVKDLRIEADVKFFGFREDAQSLMKEFDVFVLPSDQEPWGRVLCEALMAGVPVIATNAGGATDIVNDMVTGLLFPPGDVGALAEKIKLVFESPALARQLVVSGQEWVVENCAPDRHASRVMELYDSVLSDAS